MCHHLITHHTVLAEFWKHLTPESAFLAKVFIKFLQVNNMDERLDEVLPEVITHAANLSYYTDIYHATSLEDKPEYEFIISQLLETCMSLDYADEVGRRKVFELLRSIMVSNEVIDDHLTRIVRLFRIVSSDERDFTRTMIEIISDIQEQLSPFDVLDESPLKRSRLDSEPSSQRSTSPAESNDTHIRLKCLAICKNMLENSQEVCVTMVYPIWNLMGNIL